MKLKIISFFLCALPTLSYGDSRVLFTFDNSTSNNITLSSVQVDGGVNPVADVEVGKAVIKFNLDEPVGDLKINVHSHMKDAYLFVIEDGHEFQNKKLFEIKNDHGDVLATLKMNDSGQLILNDQTVAMIGLYRNANGAYQLVVADNMETFLSRVTELFKKVPGMPQQWFQSR